MLIFMQLITFFAVAYGSYIIVIDRMELPSFKTERVAHACLKKKDSTMAVEMAMERIAAWLAKYIKLDDYKRNQLEQELKSLSTNQTPEQYKAKIIVTSCSVLVLIIPCLFIFPLASIAVIVLAVIIYIKSESDLKVQIQKKREAVELELPRFCCTLKQELMASRDVLAILDNYRRNAGQAMKQELDVTCADMRSGNYESALLRFEARITSAALSDVIRGLLGVLRGDDNTQYFELLSHDMDALEIQRLEAEAAKQPGKIKKYLFLLLGSLLFTYIVIMAVFAMSTRFVA